MKLVDLGSEIIGEIREDEPLKFHTGLRMGGPARWLCIPKGIDDLRRVLIWAGKNQIPYRVIGNGSSVLVHPDGYDGLVIKLAHVLNHIRIEGNLAYVGVGATMSVLQRQLFNTGLSGLEEWYGPHSVGGWLTRMGIAGTPELDHLIKEMYIMEPDGYVTRCIEPSQLYEEGAKRNLPKLLVEVVFQLQKQSQEEIAEQIIKKEQEWGFLTQLQLPIAGPAFLNREKAIEETCAELSGLRKGQAAFLGVGNGFVANLGGATYDDVNALIDVVGVKISDRTGLGLEKGLCKLNSKEVI